MAKDRLIEFQQMAGLNRNLANKGGKLDHHRDIAHQNNAKSAETAEESTSFLRLQAWDDMESFLEHVQTTRQQMAQMTHCLRKTRELHSKILNEPGVHPKFTEELSDNVERFVKLSRSVSETVKAIKLENGRKHQQKALSSADRRIRANHEMTLRRGLLKLTEEFHKEQTAYKEKCRSRINSYLTISGLQMPEEEVDQAIESGNLFNTVGLLTAERDKKLLFEDVRLRHEDIVRLEKAIRELHDMFQDLAMLVESQGEMVNHIETNVESAKENALSALKSVKVAEEAKKRNIKLKIALAICLVIAIILLFFMGTTVFCFYMPFVCR